MDRAGAATVTCGACLIACDIYPSVTIGVLVWELGRGFLGGRTGEGEGRGETGNSRKRENTVNPCLGFPFFFFSRRGDIFISSTQGGREVAATERRCLPSSLGDVSYGLEHQCTVI